MIEIINTTCTENINIAGLSITAENDKNTISLKMVGGEEKILEMIVNTINDGLADENTASVTKTFLNILFNSVVGICFKQDDYMAKRLIKELQKAINSKKFYDIH